MADNSDGEYGRSWVPFLRQFMVCMGMCSLCFQLGMVMGTPTVVIPRMREERGEDYVSQEIASWMSSAMNYSSLPWIPIVTILASCIGRRYTFGLGIVASLVGFSLLYAGDTPQLVLGAMIVQGPSCATMFIIFFILTEYTSPENRGIFLTLKAASFYWGVWVANAIGTVAHWRYIAALGIICGLYNVVTLFLWPESPYWLASKRRMNQCKEAHRWLKGHCAASEKELQELIRSQQNPESKFLEERRKKPSEKCRQLYSTFTSKYVYKSLLMSFALHLQYCLSGKIVYTVYAIDIIKSITRSKTEAYKGMLILDGATVLGMYLGCALSHKLKRRILLFSTGTLSIVFLILMSSYLYLIQFRIILETKYVTLFLLTGFSLSVSSGPILLNIAISAELLPLRLRSTFTTVLGMISYFLAATSIKIGPWIFTNIGFPGAFLMYGLMSGIFLVLLYIYLPETKDKTLKEIENLVFHIGSKIRSNDGFDRSSSQTELQIIENVNKK